MHAWIELQHDTRWAFVPASPGYPTETDPMMSPAIAPTVSKHSRCAGAVRQVW
jgi:hypothetical protein